MQLSASFTACLSILWEVLLHRELLDFEDSVDMSYFMTSGFSILNNQEGPPGLAFLQVTLGYSCGGGVCGDLVGCSGLGPAGREDGPRPQLPSWTAGFAGLPTVVKLVDRGMLLKEREEKKRVSKTGVTWARYLLKMGKPLAFT